RSMDTGSYRRACFLSTTAAVRRAMLSGPESDSTALRVSSAHVRYLSRLDDRAGIYWPVERRHCSRRISDRYRHRIGVDYYRAATNLCRVWAFLETDVERDAEVRSQPLCRACGRAAVEPGRSIGNRLLHKGSRAARDVRDRSEVREPDNDGRPFTGDRAISFVRTGGRSFTANQPMERGTARRSRSRAGDRGTDCYKAILPTLRRSILAVGAVRHCKCFCRTVSTVQRVPCVARPRPRTSQRSGGGEGSPVCGGGRGCFTFPDQGRGVGGPPRGGGGVPRFPSLPSR